MKIPGTHCCVVSARVVLALIVSKVLFSWKVLDVVFSLLDSICNPKNLISMAHERWRLTVLLAMPTAVELSQLTGIGGWGCPISSRVTRKIAACLQLRKRAPSSASAAEATMNRKIEHSVKKAPLSLMGFAGSGFHPIKKWPQARLCAFFSER